MADGRRPPALVLGGSSNALSIARSLGALGVEVYGLGVERHVGYSRFLRPLPLPAGASPEEQLREALLGPAAERLHGAVLLAGADAGLTVLMRHRAALAERFRLDIADVEAQRVLLDKLATYDIARDAGVPTPRYCRLDEPADLERHRDEFRFPLILKPLLSHRYQERFPGQTKFRRAADLDALRREFGELAEAGIPVVLVEHIQVPDDRLCSYYTYLDESGTPTFHFTKRVVRRFPPGEGLGTHHVTDRNPEVREAALRLFKHVGCRGLVYAEFISDPRDGQLKLIECNSRFSAANALVAAAGLDLARYVYLRVLGEPAELPAEYRTGLRLLYPTEDFRAFRMLRERGEASTAGWLRSVAHRPVFPFARWDDPGPALAHAALRVPNLLRGVRARAAGHR